MGMRITGFALHHSLGIRKLIIKTYEGLTVGIKTLDGDVDMIERVVVTTLTIFGLVVDGAALDLHFSS